MSGSEAFVPLMSKGLGNCKTFAWTANPSEFFLNTVATAWGPAAGIILLRPSNPAATLAVGASSTPVESFRRTTATRGRSGGGGLGRSTCSGTSGKPLAAFTSIVCFTASEGLCTITATPAAGFKEGLCSPLAPSAAGFLSARPFALSRPFF